MAPAKLLEDKVSLVTGAGSGYGEGIAKLFAAEGAIVLVADLNEANGTRVLSDVQQAGHTAEFVKMDISKAPDWEKIYKLAISKFGKLDIVVNNAGWTYRQKDSLTVTEVEYDRVFDINVKSMFFMTQTIIPHMKERGGGAIVNISSTISEKPTNGLMWYGASKAAVDMATRHMAAEFSSSNIRINAVSPSIGQTALINEFIATGATEEVIAGLIANVPVRRLCTPLDVAKGALYFATPYFNDFQTGIILRVDGGTYI